MTFGVSLGSLLAAALVSAAVALGVEWLAKPRLEARKERILRRYQARDDVWRALDDILFAAAYMKNIQARPDDVQAAAERIVPAVRSLEEAFREVMPFTAAGHIALLASYVGMVRATMMSDRTSHEKGRLLFDCTPMIMDVLGGPGQGRLYWARRRYRVRRAGEARVFLDGPAPDTVGIPPGAGA
jgi:hypothetical protein